MLRQPGASATRVLSQSGAESREEGKGPPQVSDLFRGPGWPGIPFTPEVMVGHFAALPCPRRWRTFRPHRLVVFLPPGTAVGCSLRARGSCPVQRCSQRPECNFKPLEQYGREPVCRRRAKGTRPWPTFPPRLSSGMFFLAVLPAAWVPGLGRAPGGDGCGLPEGGSVRLASAGGGGRERQSGSRCRRHPAPRSSYRWERRPEALSPSSFPSPGDAAASPSARTRFCGLVSSQVFGAWEQRSVRRRTVRAGPNGREEPGQTGESAKGPLRAGRCLGVGREKERACGVPERPLPSSGGDPPPRAPRPPPRLPAATPARPPL